MIFSLFSSAKGGNETVLGEYAAYTASGLAEMYEGSKFLSFEQYCDARDETVTLSLFSTSSMSGRERFILSTGLCPSLPETASISNSLLSLSSTKRPVEFDTRVPTEEELEVTDSLDV